MDKAFHYRAHIILSGVQESTGCLGSCSLWVKEHYSYLEIWLDPGSLCVCVCLLWEVNILPGWWYVLLMTSGVYVARCSAFSGVQTGQNGGRSPVPVLQCSSPGFHLMVLCSCGWSCLAVLFHCGVCTAVIKKNIYCVIEGGIGAWRCCACCECQDLCTSQPASTPLLPLPDFEEYTVEHGPGSRGMNVKDGNCN